MPLAGRAAAQAVGEGSSRIDPEIPHAKMNPNW